MFTNKHLRSVAPNRSLAYCRRKVVLPTPLVPLMPIKRSFQSISSIRVRRTGAFVCSTRYVCVLKKCFFHESFYVPIVFYDAKVTLIFQFAKSSLQKTHFFSLFSIILSKTRYHVLSFELHGSEWSLYCLYFMLKTRVPPFTSSSWVK